MGRPPSPRDPVTVDVDVDEAVGPERRRALLAEARQIAGRVITIVEILEADLGIDHAMEDHHDVDA